MNKVTYRWMDESRTRCTDVNDVGELVVVRCPDSGMSPLAMVHRHGLGDVVAAATGAVGVKPCGGCKKRQQALNRATPSWARRLLGRLWRRPYP